MTSTTVGALYSQVSFLDTLFPGLGVALSYIHPLTSRKSHLGARLLCIYGLVTFLMRFAHGRVARIVEKYFTFTVEIPYTDDSYDILRNWVQSQPFATETRSMIVTLGKRAEPGNGATKNTLQYSPKNLRKTFLYKGKLVYLRSVSEEGYLHRERVFLSCMGTSNGILKEFLHDCQVTLEKQTESKTAIYMNSDDRWNLATRRGQKRINTVILPEDVKNGFFDDIAKFLDPEAVACRGYLLHGEPGTGRQNKPELGRQLLESLAWTDAGSSTSSSVTLSALLNAIDGVGSVEGRILIMTTNHANRLDPAVTRPGRVDKKVEFGLASREMLLELFRYVYLPLSSKTERVGDKDEGVVNNQVAQDTQKHIQELAAMFADRVPAMKYSPAQILSFLIAHRHSPRDAVENVSSWVEEGEGFIPLRRHTSTMNTMEEELDVDCFSATLGMELVENSQTYTVMI
ncbi:bcs1 [Cordyceps fumosorosea ARSEF 2679]|uniref:Bcs1 n=1 Tax=Cordyceps fumosorosea (strain ARSEF 2679) TaxID=1081104 RepID=A0A167H640_CORFA|nr:bcs1 [Cordyceps fumosorosea ARSEF 2679]OAA47529.1 bcs1 [Cordyceps fumosorosea ARSEF 2679]